MTSPDPVAMVALPGGRFRMGSDDHYQEEAPAHEVAVSPFAIDAVPVTNARFAAFVAATGHVTVAERAPDPALYPGADPALLVPASLVFRPAARPIPLDDIRRWWALVPGANWRQPRGPGSDIAGKDHHPVVHIAYDDALAYAHWAGKDLPTEAEHEYAARGGLDAQPYGWGAVFRPGGKAMANTWVGRFPVGGKGGWDGTAPVGHYPPNGFGLFDMIGNVWEWTQDWYAPGHDAPASPCCVPQDPRGPATGTRDPAAPIPQKVLKGGSHLCTPDYCQRYRPAARHAESLDTSTSHIGFRCVLR